MSSLQYELITIRAKHITVCFKGTVETCKTYYRVFKGKAKIGKIKRIEVDWGRKWEGRGLAVSRHPAGQSAFCTRHLLGYCSLLYLLIKPSLLVLEWAYCLFCMSMGVTNYVNFSLCQPERRRDAAPGNSWCLNWWLGKG